MTDYPQFERHKDTVALCGFAPSTRDLAPWDDPNVEIWGLNEAANFPWTKRLDRLFQIHPRWDFSRDNNPNDWNHFQWLKNQKAPCNLCRGTGKLDGTDKPCTANGCESGTYVPLSNRSQVKYIYTDKAYSDIPGSVKFPLKQAIKFIGEDKYFTSSMAYMLVLAAMMGYKRIELYGFDMGQGTEYHYQRPNAEYLIGLLRGRGYTIIVPEQSPLCKGPLYAYENMRTGYRQQLDMRIAVLNAQILEQSKVQISTQARLGMAQELNLPNLEDEAKSYNRETALLNFMKGALQETQNLIGLYDTYFIVGPDGEKGVYRNDTDQHVGVQYAA